MRRGQGAPDIGIVTSGSTNGGGSEDTGRVGEREAIINQNVAALRPAKGGTVEILNPAA